MSRYMHMALVRDTGFNITWVTGCLDRFVCVIVSFRGRLVHLLMAQVPPYLFYFTGPDQSLDTLIVVGLSHSSKGACPKISRLKWAAERERCMMGRGQEVRDGGWGLIDGGTAAQQAGIFSSIHLFVRITHLERRDGGEEGKLWEGKDWWKRLVEEGWGGHLSINCCANDSKLKSQSSTIQWSALMGLLR